MNPTSEKDFYNNNQFDDWIEVKAEEIRKMITAQTITTINLQTITRGSRVKFDKDGATLTGTVFHIMSDIGNGRKMAVVELEHELPGVFDTVPFDQLTAAPISQNFVFLSGDPQPIKIEPNDRRFLVIPNDSAKDGINTNGCEKIILLLAHLCGFNSKRLETFLCWLAYPLQNRGKKNQSAIVFKQENGAGVSLFFGEVMRPIYDGYFATIREFDLSQSTFNGWAKSARLVLCEDITIGKYSKTLIKNLINSPVITINERMLAPVTVPNEINFVFTTQKTPHELIENPSRRFIYLTPQVANDDNFYADVYGEIKLGGIEAFHKYLLSLDLTEYKRSFGCV